ncbi:MAG: bifunctional aldolase/short-chain dehydrogenase, partial [Rhodospirillales bacterium]|nr:bifunctional aldolase/short-chain dehydrogenase [Rhodospirillales bacterium]
MKNLYDERAAKRAIKQSAKAGRGADVALSVYTSRLLGGDARLVLHGGGNGSVKSAARNAAGEKVEAIYTKASGRDMRWLEAADMPALDLADLRPLLGRAKLSDGHMMRALRAAKLDPDAPDPSVETLLHAFLPHKFITHTHADAVLALTNQPNGGKLCSEAFGKEIVVAPYAMSGFNLAKQAEKLCRANPKAHGIVILKHGLFTFGDTAREAYTRMVRLVSKAEKRINQAGKPKAPTRKFKAPSISAAELAPILRGAVAAPEHGGDFARLISEFRGGAAIRAFVDGENLGRLAAKGPATPDHVIWTKPKPLVLPFIGKGGAAKSKVDAAVGRYAQNYLAYVARHQARVRAPLDPFPRIILAPGLGLFGLGDTPRAAAIAADIFEANIQIMADAERLGRYQPAGEADLFDIEYWPPEQAKRLKGPAVPALSGQVALITGGASGIGAAIASLFAANGAAVAVLDKDSRAASEVAEDIGAIGIGCDVTNGKDVARAFDQICRAYGGVDIAVSNAGAAWQGEIGTVSDTVLRNSFELNFFAHQSVAQNAVRVMRAQGTGGCLLFNTSKQAVNPGAAF